MSDRLQQLWADPANWRSVGYYYCKEDPRIIVPKKHKWMGWTMNFARPMAIPTIVLIGLLAAGPIIWLTINGYTNKPIYWAALMGDVPIICLVCAWMSSTKRFRNRN